MPAPVPATLARRMTTPARPQTVDAYHQWAIPNLTVDFRSTAIRNRYETNLQSVLNAVQGSRFVRELPAFLGSEADKHIRSTGSSLLITDELIVFRKPYESAVVKS